MTVVTRPPPSRLAPALTLVESREPDEQSGCPPCRAPPAQPQPVTLEQLLAAIDDKDAGLVEELLRQGAPPVPKDTVHVFAGSLYGFSCPIYRLMKAVTGHYLLSGPLTAAQERGAVRIMELLLGAGYRPAVYERVWVSDEGSWELPVLMPTFDPLADRPHWFPVQGKGRFVHAALVRQPWIPAAHGSFPPAFRAAARALLLSGAAAAAGRGCGAAQGQPQQPQLQKEEEQGGPRSSGAGAPSIIAAASSSTAGTSSAGGGGSCSAATLGDLPPELLRHVLGLAAYPLSSWL